MEMTPMTDSEPLDSELYLDEDSEVIKDDSSYGGVTPANTLFIDPKTGETIDASEMEPFDIIKLIARELKIPINKPKRGCKKCFERGYTAITSKNKQPIPCLCIYPKDSAQGMQFQMAQPNRINRRK